MRRTDLLNKKPLGVYLAGKIKRNGWREEIINIRRNNFGGCDYDRKNWLKLTDRIIKYDDNIYITGPFFLACDHGCYHGEGSHGVGANSHYGCYGEHTMKGSDVNTICKIQIQKSDIVFAYINNDTCYGTMSEIGYAAALGKKIIILFDTEKRRRDMWFIDEFAYMSKIETDELFRYKSLKEKFEYMIYEYCIN